MRHAVRRKDISFTDMALLDLVRTGEAALMAGCDRRTFIAHANRMGIEPVAKLKGGQLVYKHEDAVRVAKEYKKKKV